MRATLDGTVEFEVGQLKVESWQREVVERAVAGLDGVRSIDLGARSRELVVKGILRAVSDESLRKNKAVISALMDGQTHTLVTGNGREFDNVRIDAFESGQKDYSGRGVYCEFEIRCTQLRNL